MQTTDEYGLFLAVQSSRHAPILLARASMITQSTQQVDQAAIMGALYGEGIVGLKAAFDPAFADRMHEDVLTLYAEASAIPGGAIGRGPERYYVEVHPERIRGFVALATHPWVVAVCEAVLGPDYKIVEIGFDIPFPGALYQPWHRDFPSPEATLTGRRLNSLAFNLTTVDVTPEMGPFEVAVGTQWDAPDGFAHGMFPPRSLYSRYEPRAQQKRAQRGDISARTALTIHRGTPNRSQRERPALVLGVDAPDARNAERHDLQFTRGYYGSLPEQITRHVTCRVVDELVPIVQAHTIEGLVMGQTDGDANSTSAGM
jgi:hypothetical protein